MNTDVHPYYRSILDAYARSNRRHYYEGSAPEARELLRSSLAAAPPQANLPSLRSVTDERVKGAGGDIRVRIYLPEAASVGSCILLHAGGWVIGDLTTNDALARRLCAGAACEVVNVDYRLAPEHPYPAALDDVFSVLQWCAAGTRQPIVLAGESSGGNLAAACAIRARDQPQLSVVGQFLAYPVTDHDFQTPSYRAVGSRDLLLSTADMQWFWDHYCPAGVDRDRPLVSPLRLKDASNLPPALIFVAELDPLRDEGLAYVQHLAAAGVPVTSRTASGMLHGYLSAAGAVPTAADDVRAAAEWIGARLRGEEIRS